MKPLWLTIFAAALALPAWANDDGTDPSATIEREQQTVVVNADGSFVADVERTVLIHEERGVKTFAQQSVHYNRSLEAVNIVEAYTQKPDGRRAPVTPEQVKEQQEQASVGAPMFQDTRIKTMIFPEVAVGDRIHYHYRTVRSTPMYPGQFEDGTWAPIFKVLSQTVRYSMPTAMALHSDARGYVPAVPRQQGDRTLYEWSLKAGDNPRIENGSVAYTDHGRRLLVSTFADYAAMAKAYDERARPAAAVTPTIAELV